VKDFLRELRDIQRGVEREGSKRRIPKPRPDTLRRQSFEEKLAAEDRRRRRDGR